MSSRWVVRQAERETGPLPFEELVQRIRSGEFGASQFVKSASDDSWRPAALWPELADLFPTAPPPPPSSSLPPNAKPIWPWVVGTVGLFGLVVVVLVALAAFGGGAPADVQESPPASDERYLNPLLSEAREPAAPALAVSGEDATEELGRIFAAMSFRQQNALGLFRLGIGQDVYGVRVTIVNRGRDAIWVRPEKIRLHLRGETIGVQTCDDPRFLQTALLQPGEQLEALVMYRAAFAAGAAMRLGAGSISYEDEF